MSGSSGAEILAGGPADDEKPTAPPRPALLRPPWLLPSAAALLGLAVGAAGAHGFWSAGSTGSARAPGSVRPTAASTARDLGVVVPEVVDAQTLPGTGGMEVVAEAVPGASTPGALRYDYRLDGAVWLAPDGTVRSGPPGCVLAEGEPEQVQYLQVAVVHARAVDGGPNADRVVWYRCAAFPPSSTGP